MATRDSGKNLLKRYRRIVVGGRWVWLVEVAVIFTQVTQTPISAAWPQIFS